MSYEQFQTVSQWLTTRTGCRRICSIVDILLFNNILAKSKKCPYPLMYSAHLHIWASVPNSHDGSFNEQPNDQRRGSHTKEIIPVMPRTKPEGETQVGSQPMRIGLGRRDYSGIKTTGARTRIPDHSCPPLLPLLHPPSYPPPPPQHSPKTKLVYCIVGKYLLIYF